MNVNARLNERNQRRVKVQRRADVPLSNSRSPSLEVIIASCKCCRQFAERRNDVGGREGGVVTPAAQLRNS